MYHVISPSSSCLEEEKLTVKVARVESWSFAGGW
jgi:hypothetical protein